MKLSFPQLLWDIRFWIILFFVVRLYAITNPPLEVGHNWRQTDGTMIARNFYEHNANILYPTVDVGGDLSGIVGSEFPLLNYFIYLISVPFGYEHWYGRLVVLFFSSLGMFFFYRLVLKFFGEKTAFNATILLLVSLWFSYARKIIPDAFALSFCLAGLYYAFDYLETGKWQKLLLYLLLGLLGGLAKISAVTMFSVLLLPVLDAKYLLRYKVFLCLASGVILAGIGAWYFVWVPYLNETNGLGEHFYMGDSFKDGIAAILAKWPQVLKRFYDTPMKYTGFIAFLAGLVMIIRKKDWLPLWVFLLSFCSFLVILVKTGSSIIGDTYYVLTMVPPMALVAGYGIAQLTNRKIVAFILLVISVEGIASQIYDFRIRQPFKALETLEVIMDEVSERDDLIVINCQAHEPTLMYFAHRKGWTNGNEALREPNYLNYVKARGCKYVLIAKKQYGDLNLDLPIVHDSEYFKVYKLQ